MGSKVYNQDDGHGRRVTPVLRYLCYREVRTITKSTWKSSNKVKRWSDVKDLSLYTLCFLQGAITRVRVCRKWYLTQKPVYNTPKIMDIKSMGNSRSITKTEFETSVFTIWVKYLFVYKNYLDTWIVLCSIGYIVRTMVYLTTRKSFSIYNLPVKIRDDDNLIFRS